MAKAQANLSPIKIEEPPKPGQSHPLLTEELLKHLDEMGHPDTVIIVDAHLPAPRLAKRLVTLPRTTFPEVLEAVRSVLPLGITPAVALMTSADGAVLDVQTELRTAAGVTESEIVFIGRLDFYTAADDAYVVIRSGETPTQGCVIARKGHVGHVSA